MADTVDEATRSRIMASVKAKNTRPELALRKALHALGFRFRLHRKGLPGTPDLVLAKYRAAVFVHGCYWHRHEGCRYASVPITRADFWNEKFRTNIERDRKALAALQGTGWRTAIIWECALKNDSATSVGKRLADWLASPSPLLTIPSSSPLA
jgi:DNA mismatch endonuclease (patch repair protein)